MPPGSSGVKASDLHPERGHPEAAADQAAVGKLASRQCGAYHDCRTPGVQAVETAMPRPFERPN